MSTATQEQYKTTGPDSFVIEHDRTKALNELITREGLYRQVTTFLGERAGLPVYKPFDIELIQDSDPEKYGFFSDQFPNTMLRDLYNMDAHEPVFDYRKNSDVEYIRQIEDWTKSRKDNFAWVQFSPTSNYMGQQMSFESVFEIGEMYTSLDGTRRARIHRMTSPFAQGDDITSTLVKMRKIAGDFDPKLANTENELQMLENPVLLTRDNPNLSPELFRQIYQTGTFDMQNLINVLDSKLMNVNEGRIFKYGQEVINEGDGDLELAYNKYNMSIDALKEQIWEYVDACFDSTKDLTDLRKRVLSFVNQFDRMYKTGQAIDRMGDTEHWAVQHVEDIRRGCGALGKAGKFDFGNGITGKIPQLGIKGGEDVICKCGRYVRYLPDGKPIDDLKCPNPMCGMSLSC